MAKEQDSYQSRKSPVIRALIGPRLVMGLEPSLISMLWGLSIGMIFIFKTPIFIPLGLFIQWVAIKATKKDPEMRKVWLLFRTQALRYDPYPRAHKKAIKDSKISVKPKGFGLGGI